MSDNEFRAPLTHQLFGNYNQLSEDQRYQIIRRVLDGDLQGKVSLSEDDMILYNKKAYGIIPNAQSSQSANPSGLYNYIPKSAQQPQQIMDTTPLYPQQTAPTGMSYVYPQGYNMTQYQYPSTYYNPNSGYYGGYNPYGGYYNPYGGYYGGYYPQQPQQSYSDPVYGMIDMFFNQSSDYLLRTYGLPQQQYSNYYGGYYPQQSPYPIQAPTVRTELNPPVDMQMTDYDKQYLSGGTNMFAAVIADDNPYIEQQQTSAPIYANLPSASYYNNYGTGMYSMYGQPPLMPNPYMMYNTPVFREELKKRQDDINWFYDQCMGATFGSMEAYNAFKAKHEEDQKTYQERLYNLAHQYDNTFTPEEMREHIKEQNAIQDNLNKAMKHIYPQRDYYGRLAEIPVNIDYERAMIVNAYNASIHQQVTEASKYQDLATYLNEFLAPMLAKERIDNLIREAHYERFKSYRPDLYRTAIITDNPNSKYAALGFKSEYDPLTGRVTTSVSPPAHIKAKYDERRAQYLNAAAQKQGG